MKKNTNHQELRTTKFQKKIDLCSLKRLCNLLSYFQIWGQKLKKSIVGISSD